MIGRLETLLRRLRRFCSRSEWLRRLLKLPVSAGLANRPGLVLIQIDGLSREEMELAMQQGELPFLRRLIKREHYHLHTHYSGLPSTTPAVQAELFYGARTAVPAFSFCDIEIDRIVSMLDPGAVRAVERRLDETADEALLAGGSAYVANYTGGSDEAHFCPSALGWGPALRAANPFVLVLFLASNLYSLLRTALLLLLEFALALFDFVRGTVGGLEFLQELKFVPTRVAICILMRELSVIGAKIDINRGLPVVQINFLGYDEQSHRRGPRSKFAHWTLKGIDDAIKRLWRAANHSPWRHYDVWIYSDHGQIRALPYEQQQGRTIDEAVAATLHKLGEYNSRISGENRDGIETQRVRFLGGVRFQRLFAVLGLDTMRAVDWQSAVAALGPVGFVYTSRALDDAERRFVANELATAHGVPLVISRGDAGQLYARAGAEELQLPQQIAELFGSDHPFIDQLGDDLLRLCRHANAGEIALFGWRKGAVPLTFVVENGSHGGASPQETRAFALLPGDLSLPASNPGYLRPADLYRAALIHLGRRRSEAAASRRREARLDRLRVMTYNVHGCVGMDGKLSVERIARVIARCKPDVVALQELDVGRERSGGIDQAELIARSLEMDFHFHASLQVEEERYGDAILTHLPMRLVKAAALPGAADTAPREPRGALWVAIDLHGEELQLINTHLGLNPRERLAQVEALCGNEWLAHEKCRAPVIFCGDLNASPASRVCRLLRTRLDDAQSRAARHRPRKTFAGRLPTLRIDHIFIDPELEVSAIEVPRSQLVQVASDHLPLLAELLLPRRNVRS